jgi:hypothetical protein
MLKFVDYPLTTDSNFYYKLLKKREFYELGCEQLKLWKNPEKYIWSVFNNDLSSLPHQKFVQRYLCTLTPYRGMLNFWNTGVGKTWGSIGICEANKSFLDMHKTKATIITPNKLILDVFKQEILGARKRNGRIEYVLGATKNSYICPNLRLKLNSLPVKQQSKITKFILENRVSKYYNFDTHEMWYAKVLAMNPEQIKKTYSNCIILVDEIQQSKNSKSNLYNALEFIVKFGRNNKLILLSATPMVDSAEDICQPINLLRLNDGMTELVTPDLIRQMFNKKNVEEATEARKKFKKMIRGYVSYMRGLNPFTFPERIDHGVPIFKNINFKLIQCHMKGKQLINYVKEFMKEFVTNIDLGQKNDLWNNTRDASRCFTPEGCGGVGIKAYKIMELDNLQEYSSKFWEIWKNGKDVNGPKLLYAFNVERGVNKFEHFLLKNGVKEFDANCPSQSSFFNFGKCKDFSTMKKVVKHLKNNSCKIQWLLGSSKVRYGITFHNISQIHILEPDWNIASTEQLIGRGVRHFSHISSYMLKLGIKIDPGKCDVFKYRASLPKNTLQILPYRLCRRFKCFLQANYQNLLRRGFIGPKGELLSIDEYMYSVALIKDHRIRKIERILKECAIDAAVNVYSNYFTFESLKYSGQRISDYMFSEYTLPIPNQNDPLRLNQIIHFNRSNLDNSTYDLVKSEVSSGYQDSYTDYNEKIDVSIANCFNVLGRDYASLTEILKLTKVQPKTLFDRITTLIENKVTLPNQKFLIHRFKYYIQVPLFRDKYELEGVPLSLINTLKSRENSKTLSENGDFKVLAWMKNSTQMYDFFPIKQPTHKFRFPDYYLSDLFRIHDNAVIHLVKDKFAGVIDNTKDDLHTYNLKICQNCDAKVKGGARRQKKALRNFSVDEIHKFYSQRVGVKPPVTRSKEQLERTMTKILWQKGMILPWTMKEQPKFYTLLQMCKKWKLVDLFNLIVDLEQMILKEKITHFIQTMIDLVNHRSRNEGFDPNRTLEEFKNNCIKIPHYTLLLVDYMMCPSRPKLFKSAEWKIVQSSIQKIIGSYSKQIGEILFLAKQEIVKRIKHNF